MSRKITKLSYFFISNCFYYYIILSMHLNANNNNNTTHKRIASQSHHSISEPLVYDIDSIDLFLTCTSNTLWLYFKYKQGKKQKERFQTTLYVEESPFFR